jgi:ketosteroid isomerase-like protein
VQLKFLFKATLLSISALGLFPAEGHAGDRPQKNPEAEIIQFEQSFSSSLARNDVAALEQYLSPDWRIVSGDGQIIERKTFLKVIASGDLKHDKMSLDQPTIRLHGDTALATSRAKSGGTYRGVAFQTDEIGTDVIVRIRGRWVCVFTQLTTVVQK